MTNEISLVDSPIDFDNIRKIWHRGEWHYSVIDKIIHSTHRDQKAAQNYWKNLKSEFKHDLHSFKGEIISFKALARDNKLRSTDFANEETCKQLLDLIEHLSFHTVCRLEKKFDEVADMHPIVLSRLAEHGWATLHHFNLPSGKTVDIIAEQNKNRLIIECKKHLRDTEFFTAVGQVLCYASEYPFPANPTIACFRENVSDYSRTYCTALGIAILEV